MVILSNSDMFEVRINSLLADYDRDTITTLYQPIIGYTALAIFFTLWSEANVQKVLSFSSHEQLFSRMKIAPGNFIEARKVLEGVGLLKTKLEKAPGTSIYHYELNAPKTPERFFADTLLYGMLIQALGENDASRLKRVYELEQRSSDGEDISSTFNDVFHPDFEDKSFLLATNDSGQMIGRNNVKLQTEFSYSEFFKYLGEISQISDRAISKKEMKEVERLASLYGVDEEVTAKVVANAYNPRKEKGERLDFKAINEALMDAAHYSHILKRGRNKSKSTVTSETQIASKINLFEKVSPYEMLSILQGGTKVAPSDIKIIDILSKDYALNNGVVNVIIDFVLSMNKNILSKAYAEKIAASFNRENIETTIDAMNYCNEVLASTSGRKKSKVTNNNEDEIEIKTTKSKTKKGEVSQEEWDELFEDNKEDSDNGETDTELPF